MTSKRNPIVYFGALLIALGWVSGCDKLSGEDGVQYSRQIKYWNSADGKICTHLAGSAYCFDKAHINAQAFESDAAAGFLFIMPVSQRTLTECNKQRWSLNKEFHNYASIQISVSEPYRGDTVEKIYDRTKNLLVGENSKDLVRPLQHKEFNGQQCLILKRESLLHDEMVCQSGAIFTHEPASFLSCQWDGSVPNPGCRDNFFNNGLIYSASYDKECAPYSAEIRRIAINYINTAMVRGK